MNKMKLYELAKELDISCTTLIEIGTELGMRSDENQKNLSNLVILSEEEVKKLKEAHKASVKVAGSPSDGSEGVKKATKKEAMEGKKKKKKKKKSVYVFDNEQTGSAYSSDQRGAYVPKTRQKRKVVEPKKVVDSEETLEEKKKPETLKGDIEVTKTLTVPKEEAVSAQSAEKKEDKSSQKPSPESLIGQIVKPAENRTAAGRAPSVPSKSDKDKSKGKKKQKVIIGTISNADYSRPMPMGRPSSTVGMKKRPPAPGRKVTGRPSGAGRKTTDDRRAGGGVPSWKRKEVVVPEEEITKSGGKRRGQKKKDAPIDRDKLDKKAKNSKKKILEYGRGEFDFGKKRKQKALKYKERQIKEKSEKLDELLQKETVYIPEEITVKEFAEKINKNASEIIMKLVGMGKMLSINNLIEFEDAALIAIDYNIELDLEVEETIDYA